MRSFFALPLFTVLILAVPAAAQEDEARLLRFPTIHGNQVVFTYAGNLFSVAGTGGVARQLTSHEGFEMFPRFSPDGKWLAFTGQYDGNTEVYVMPAEGGPPKRLTFTGTLGRDDVSDRMGPNNVVMGWMHDNKHIVFRSRMHEHNDFLGQLYLVSIDGGLPEQLPLPRGGFCSFSPDDSKLVYNRVFREFRTWKRYRGGMADDLWIYDFKTKKTEPICTTPDQEIIPMWSGDKIYFLSDRDALKRMNLYVYDTVSKQTKQLTHFRDFDIKFPSLGDKAIVFEYGGWLYRFDLASEKASKITVRILDDAVGGRAAIVNVSKNISTYDLSPDGKRALFGARGDIFTVPAKDGPTRDLTKTSGVHERDAEWSPDGKKIAFISDASGEDEIWTIAPDGRSAPEQLTKAGVTYKYDLHWSPDSKKIAWADKLLRLQTVDLASKETHEIAKATAFEIRDYAWSSDSNWIAYTRPEEESVNRVYLYSMKSGKSTPVTDQWFNSGSPAFSGDGKYLFFTSARDFNPTNGQTEFNHIYQDMSRIYLLTLARDTESPFKPKSDETGEAAKPATPATKEKEPAKKAEPEAIKVDLEGIIGRIVDLPVAAANYNNLNSVGSTLYFERRSSKDPRSTLCLFDLTDHKETVLGPVGGFVISADKKKMIVSRDGSYSIIDLPKAPLGALTPLNLSGMEMKLDHHQEWQQIFNESWRQMREFFYDPNMHGVDWAAMRKKYEPLVAHVNHRADLSYVIGEMIAELNVGHAYVGGGEMPVAHRIPQGLLGADLVRDPKSGYYRIVKILPGANWDKALRSPLTELDVGAKEGDYLIAIDGLPTNEMTNPYEALVNKAGKPVYLKLNSTPNERGSKEVTVTPTADETKLYYYRWVQDNIKKVNDATDGKVGYLHVPDMLTPGLNEFAKYYYPQLRKKALIIDMRGNGGGNVSAQLIERLRREAAMIAISRDTAPTPEPGGLMNGPMICLINEFSASDGDIFPYRFRKYKLGKLIGKRTWGGVVGIRGSLPLLDGGTLMKPEFSRYDTEGKEWIIEGKGVEPDIIVDNDPSREFNGIDDQLNKAIEVIKEELKTKEKKVPAPPPYPKR
ncbi:MAG TPA: S41 family peptidase [Gemmataceae bacterium]|jgi:tricorn protease|nr:S41 family peptidase [Gemmataceae bacterium]